MADADAAAFRQLSDRHLRSIVHFAGYLLGNDSEAEDVAQETFLRMWNSAARYEPRAKVSTYLHRIARNLCVDRLRKRREGASDNLDDLNDGDRPSALLVQKQRSQRVTEAIGDLPERQAIAITLVHLQGLTNIEAAEVLEVSVEALESLLARARRSLRGRLKPMMTEN